jgi:DNA (cytosine-5)-methyltransferase 1
MSGLRALDCFCGAGGATRGLQQAGFARVDGVDLVRQRRYVGDTFIQADALEILKLDLRAYDFIWASPPCQAPLKPTRTARR